MKWRMMVENPPGSNVIVDAGLPIWDDGYPEDGSGWGDEESNAISDYQQYLKSIDPQNRCYYSIWAGNG